LVAGPSPAPRSPSGAGTADHHQVDPGWVRVRFRLALPARGGSGFGLQSRLCGYRPASSQVRRLRCRSYTRGSSRM